MNCRMRSAECRVALALLVILGCGCAATRSEVSRRFDFQKDTLAFPNQLTWEYHYTADGKWTTEWRQPPPDYSQHCFVVARTVRQFFLNARFAPEQPRVNDRTYRGLIRRVIATSPRHEQEKMASQLFAHVQQNQPIVVLLVRFPQLTINHAIVLFDAQQTAKEIRFIAYDPNRPDSPKTIDYDRASRTFQFAANDYFPGGKVDVYEVYRGCFY